ncbi:MAG: hypothetical protein AB7I57_18325 [Pirellulales bacterium]
MAKNKIKGASWKLYLNTGTRVSPTWVEIKDCGDVNADNQPDDVTVPERGMGTGHLNGENDPLITFDLFLDTGDSNIETMVAAIYSGAMVEIAVCPGPIATAGLKALRLESLLRAPVNANRSDVTTYNVSAFRHANSDFDLTRFTTS